MTQPRLRMAQLRVIVLACLYLAKIHPVLRIGDIVQLVERANDGLEIACSSPLYATIFLPTMFAHWHTCLQVETPILEWLKRDESNRVYLFQTKFLSLVYISYLSRKGPALRFGEIRNREEKISTLFDIYLHPAHNRTSKENVWSD